MKSIMEEASSIAKAVEKGWERAGKPKEFTVRIFEEAQKNFIGMTTKPAKVGILFQEPVAPQYRTKDTQRLVEKRKAEKTAKAKERFERQERQVKERKKPVQPEEQPKVVKKDRWTEEMQQKASVWLEGFLKSAQLPSVSFAMEAKNYILSVQFQKPLLSDNAREHQIYKNCSYLLLQALKYHFKRGLKGYKVVISSK